MRQKQFFSDISGGGQLPPLAMPGCGPALVNLLFKKLYIQFLTQI